MEFSEMLKVAEGLFGQHESETFIPHKDAQAVWRFAVSGDTLRLHQPGANHVFQFKIAPDADISSGGSLTRVEDVSHHDLDKDAAKTGKAQVHRSDPGRIYLTLHDGRANPTFTIYHDHGSKWKLIPKRPPVKTANLSHLGGALINNTGAGVYNHLLWAAHNPIGAAGSGVLGAVGYDQARRHLMRTQEERDEEDQYMHEHPIKATLNRFGKPLALSLATALAAGNTFSPSALPMRYIPLQ